MNARVNRNGRDALLLCSKCGILKQFQYFKSVTEITMNTTHILCWPWCQPCVTSHSLQLAGAEQEASAVMSTSSSIGIQIPLHHQQHMEMQRQHASQTLYSRYQPRRRWTRYCAASIANIGRLRTGLLCQREVWWRVLCANLYRQVS